MVTGITPSHHWYIDFGASAHICKRRDQFKEYTPRSDNGRVVLGDNTHLQIKGEGKIRIYLGKDKYLLLEHTLHVPDISKNLVSVCKLTAQPGTTLTFAQSTCQMKTHFGVKATGTLLGELYLLDVSDHGSGINIAAASTSPTEAQLWHAWLGHPNAVKLQRITKTDIYQDRLKENYLQLPFCEACVRAKHRVAPYPTGGAV